MRAMKASRGTLIIRVTAQSKPKPCWRLRTILQEAIESRLDLDVLERVKRREKAAGNLTSLFPPPGARPTRWPSRLTTRRLQMRRRHNAGRTAGGTCTSPSCAVRDVSATAAGCRVRHISSWLKPSTNLAARPSRSPFGAVASSGSKRNARTVAADLFADLAARARVRR